MAKPKTPRISELLNPDKAQHLAVKVAQGGSGKTPPEFLVFAELISKLQWVHNEINAARARIGVNSLHQLPPGISANAILEVVNKLSPTQARKLLMEGRRLSARLNLRGWDMTIWGIVLTNQLVLFPATEKIVLHLPKSRPTPITRENALHKLLSPGAPSKKSLVIEIRERVSRNQIEEFINKKKEIIDSYLEAMPGIKQYKIQNRVLILGQAIWLVEQAYPEYNRREVLGELKSLKKEIKNFPVPPDTETDLNDLYAAYRKYLSSV